MTNTFHLKLNKFHHDLNIKIYIFFLLKVLTFIDRKTYLFNLGKQQINKHIRYLFLTSLTSGENFTNTYSSHSQLKYLSVLVLSNY